MRLVLIYALFVLCFKSLNGFYLPGIAPVNYCKIHKETDTCKNEIPVFVNKLNSARMAVPYEYNKFDFCKTDDYAESENLGQVIFGERIRSSPYSFDFGTNVNCKLACTKQYNPETATTPNSKLAFLRNKIVLNYQHHWIVDNLPVMWCLQEEDDKDHTSSEYCLTGFPIGCFVNKEGVSLHCPDSFKQPESFYLFNHLEFTVTYHQSKNTEWGSSLTGEGGRIISVKVQISSDSSEKCERREPMILPKRLKSSLSIPYTYSVKFKVNNNIKWSSRWDYILSEMPRSQIKWFSIINSVVIVLFLSGILGLVLLRTIRKDVSRYNRLDNILTDDAQEEFGWKLMHGDVFRPPRWGMFLSVCVGGGCQLGFMLVITLVFACLGFLSPANRGSLMTCAIVLYFFLGIISGYVSARIYKTFGGQKWKSNLLLTSLLVPAIVFGIYFCLNLILWALDSSGAVPFTTMLALLALWAFIAVPLCFVGAFFGFRKPMMEFPVRTNQIPRQIPEQACHNRGASAMIFGGLLPFGCILMQLIFILNSVWSLQIFSMMGMLLVAWLLTVVVAGETALLMCYFQLCAEDYRWWWRAFNCSGFCAFYVFLYSLVYFFTKLEISGLASTTLYFGYTLLFSGLFYLTMGAIGFLTTLWFLTWMFSLIKVD